MRTPKSEKLLHYACHQGSSVLGGTCELSEDIVEKILDDAARRWHVDDTFFADHDLHDIVDCASDGDAIYLDTSTPVQPRRQIEISKRLEIRASRSPDMSTKATLTCPPNDSLFVIRSVQCCHDIVVDLFFF